MSGLGFNYASQMGRDRPGRKPNPENSVDLNAGTPGVDYELIIVRTEEEEEALEIYNTEAQHEAHGVRVIDSSSRLKKEEEGGVRWYYYSY